MKKAAVVALGLLLLSAPLYAEQKNIQVSGYLKSLNTATRSTGLQPLMAHNPIAVGEKGEDLFISTNRARLKFNWEKDQPAEPFNQFKAVVEYDHQMQAGSFVNSNDYLIIRKNIEDRQGIDLSGTLVDDDGFVYEHSLYRGYISAKTDLVDFDLGRQQIPWGVGRFFTPTDVFNPFNFSQVEWDERQGVDAVNLKKRVGDYKINYVYTPRGKRLHPSRHMAKITRDIQGYEVSLLGGTIAKNEAIGYDLQGNVGDAVLRSEFIFQNAENEKDFAQFLIDMDYRFKNGVYALLEYYYNGRGKSDSRDYEISRAVRGEIQEMGRNYLGMELGYDITPLLRIENRTVLNLDDLSAFNRVELRYEINQELIMRVAGLFDMGDSDDEFGAKQNAYFVELQKYF
jgi:hypothetical protein